MKTYSIELDDIKAEELEKKADKYGLPVYELIKAAFDDLLSKPDEDFEKWLKNIIKKRS